MAELNSVSGAEPADRDTTNSGEGMGVKMARRNKQPVVEEAVSDAGEDEVDPVVEAAEDVVADTKQALNSKRGREELAMDIDGDNVESRSLKQADALDKSFDSLEDRNALDVEVVGVSPGKSHLLGTKDGELVDARLAPGEKSRLETTSTGQKVLLVDETLNTEEVVGEASVALAGIIAEAVVDYGGMVNEAFFDLFSDRNLGAIGASHHAYSIEYGGHILRMMEI